MLLLFALWEFAGQWSLGQGDDAVARGQAIWGAERALRLPSEAWLQSALLPQHWLIQGANYYYAVMHFGVMIGFLLWVFLRHRSAYPRVRALLVTVTGASLLVQLLPVAPPRLVSGTGMVDTGLAYGQSVYAGAGAAGVTADGLAAMPSVHVAWCVLVAACVLSVSRSRWRWLALLHVALTVLVVVVTANHYWLDGVAGAALVAAAWPLGPAVQRRTWGRSSSSQ
ncbi:phosphatase PAP2 family protein [Phaeacidiphilus oryzae]|uniref:phosphatase PAP2 family protein n=1 Tax=Phaeacidiphilus oryzae TaxID=348818 RepID=UPI001376E2C7|nr:phosphatase PAP2 family protein [Phaeacidiphilus oryzae]